MERSHPCEVHVNTMEGFWSLLRSWLRPHRGISQEKLPLYLGFFEFVHNVHKRGKALLGALMELLVIDRQLGASSREVLYDNLPVDALLVFLALAVADHKHGAIHADSTDVERQHKAAFQAGIDDVSPLFRVHRSSLRHLLPWLEFQVADTALRWAVGLHAQHSVQRWPKAPLGLMRMAATERTQPAI